MARARELFTRLLVARRMLASELYATGGDLRIGLYNLAVDENGFASRAATWARQVGNDAATRTLMPFTADLVPLVAAAGMTATQLKASDQVAIERPKLHMKVQFLATADMWAGITGSPEWPAFMSTYLQYRAATYKSSADAERTKDLLQKLARSAEVIMKSADPHGASYALVGSQNQDYRGMFMDGEVGILFTASSSLIPLLDLAFLEGTVTWLDDVATLDRLIPPVGELRRRLSRITKDAL
jgi:hypothetical protein